MSTRIKNGKDSYLYCSVDCEVGNYQDDWNSSQECMEDITPDIIEDCEKRLYTKEETQKVIQHYEIQFNNAAGRWKNLYE